MKIKYLKQKYSYVKTFILWSIDVLRIFGRLKEVTVQKSVVQQVLHCFAKKKRLYLLNTLLVYLRLFIIYLLE